MASYVLVRARVGNLRHGKKPTMRIFLSDKSTDSAKSTCFGRPTTRTMFSSFLRHPVLIGRGLPELVMNAFPISS
jgi:hypothetical protein